MPITEEDLRFMIANADFTATGPSKRNKENAKLANKRNIQLAIKMALSVRFFNMVHLSKEK